MPVSKSPIRGSYGRDANKVLANLPFPKEAIVLVTFRGPINPREKKTFCRLDRGQDRIADERKTHSTEAQRRLTHQPFGL